MKVIMFCAGGLSSSLLVNKVNEAARKRNINLVYEAYGSRSFTKLEGADALLVAPQVRHLKKTYDEKVKMPTAYIDFKSYGSMDGDAVLNLALDLLNLNEDI